MILSGFTISGEEMVKFKNFRRSPLYAIYLKTIAGSPTFRAIMKEHIDQIDVRPDIKKMKDEGRIPEGVSEDLLNKMIILSFARMTVPLIADALILKELEQLKIDEVIQDLKSDTDIAYLLGMADESLYTAAEKLIEEGKLKEDDLAYKGIVQFYKRTGKIKDSSGLPVTLPTSEPKPKAIKKEKPKFDLDAQHIDL
jgi:hypothetical protein